MQRKMQQEELTVGPYSRFICAVALLAGAGLLASPAMAVHDLAFELDGNIVGGDLPNPPAVDWGDLFTTGTMSDPPEPAMPLPAGFGEPSFDRDFEVGGTGDDSYFATGSADVLNPGPVMPGDNAGWQCKSVNNSGDKFDLLNVYAAPYTAPNGDIIIYFAAERVKNEGVTNIGFWFFQDSTVGCTPGPGNTDFTGNHADGDLFIVAEYTKGGDTNTIQVYKWEGGADGALNETPVVSGADCRTTGADDAVCAIVNNVKLVGSGPGTDIPWLTQTFDKGDILSELDTGLFFEGGLNLTKANLSACFTKFMGVTRSSFSLGADLKDYALKEFNLCSIDVSKTSTCVDFDSDSSGNLTFNNEAIVTVLNDGGAPLPANSVSCCDNAGTGEPQGSDNESMTDDDQCFTIPDVLAPGDSVDTTVSFSSSMNGPDNKVFCTADLGGGANTSDGGEAPTTQCSASPDLYVDKDCATKLIFDDPAGRVVVKVTAGGQVCNTSSDNDDPTAVPVPITNVLVVDDKAGTLLSSVTLDAGTACESDQDCADQGVGGDCVGFDMTTGKDGVCRNTTDGTDGIFFGGAVCADYTGMYLPDSTDSGTMDPTLAEFSDQVTATGTVDDDLQTAVDPEMASATCKLCPPEEICPACQ
jgi:hypothetical protein